MKLTKGFTLAEVLIVLGIIGVISALTLPTFTASTSNAQIGPKLGKAVASFEEAAHVYMQQNKLEHLSEIEKKDDESQAYAIFNALRANMNFEAMNPKSAANAYFITKDGTKYIYFYSTQNPAGDYANSTLPKDYYIGTVTINIKGSDEKTIPGKNSFDFALYDDGSLVPFGSKNWAKWKEDGGKTWQTECPNKPATVAKDGGGAVDVGPYLCAGSIFEQGMKVNYKLSK